MTKLHITELLPAYALDRLDQDEAQAVAAHLEACASCRHELAAYQRAASQIALSAPLVGTPPGLKNRLMAQIRPAASRARPAPASFWKRLWGTPRPAVLAMQLATLLIIVTLGATDVAVWRQVDQEVASVVEAGLQTIRLKGTELAPTAKGMVIISGDGKHGLIYVDGLPFLEARQVYQAWMGEIKAPLNAGLLDLNPQGHGWLEVTSQEQRLVDYPLFRVTIEPAGGSPQPGSNVALMSYSP